MVVVAFDPYVSKEDAAQLGVEMASLDELYARADYITFHTPLTPDTKGMVNATAIAKMKDGVRIVNCARGALVNEADLLAPSRPGRSPVRRSTSSRRSPHLPTCRCWRPQRHPHAAPGRRDDRGPGKVAVLIAEQICDFLKKGRSATR